MVFRCEGLINSTVNTDWFQYGRIAQFFKNINTGMVPEFNFLEVFTQIQLTQSTSTAVAMCNHPKVSEDIVTCVHSADVLKTQVPHLTLLTLHH